LVVDSAALADFDPPSAPPPGRADECALLYTSGTTGKPKGCLLSNFYFLNIGQRYVDEGGLCALRFGEERLITPLPLFHMNALAVSTMAMILSAGCIVQLERFHPRTWWRDVAQSRATIVHYLGVMPAILMQLPPSAADRAHPRRGCCSGDLRAEAASAGPWREGWFPTGDCGRRGADGSLYFIDRRKNIIRRAGENIAALEVEGTIAEHPAVAQVAVIAAPD